MKLLKSEQEYKYDDFRELQCGVCKKKVVGQRPGDYQQYRHNREIINNIGIKCPQCSTIYTFEPTRWRVLADVSEE